MKNMTTIKKELMDFAAEIEMVQKNYTFELGPFFVSFKKALVNCKLKRTERIAIAVHCMNRCRTQVLYFVPDSNLP